MIKEYAEGIKAGASAVQLLGPVPVAFFILLGFLMYIQYASSTRIESVHNVMAAQIDSIDTKIDAAKETDELVVYFLREICKQGAETEAERSACNPPPIAKLSLFGP